MLRGRYQSRPPGVSQGLEAIIRKAMSPDPQQRYRHAMDLHEDLLAWLEGRPVRAMVRSSGAAGGLWYRVRLMLRRNRRAVAVVFLLAALVAAAWAWWPREQHLDRSRVAREHMQRAHDLESGNQIDAARRAARDALREDPDLTEAFVFLRRLDDARRLSGHVERARLLRREAEAAFAAGDVERGQRRQAALEEVLTTSVLPVLDRGANGTLASEAEALLRFARGLQPVRVSSAPADTRFFVIPLDAPGGLIAWNGARPLAADRDTPGAAGTVRPGAWILRMVRAEGEVLVPFTAEPGGAGVDLVCPIDPAMVDAASVYVGAGLGRGPMGPRAVKPLLWDRAEVTAARYAAFLESLPPEEQRRRVPRLAGRLGGLDEPLWDALGTGFEPPAGALRRPLEGISLYDAEACARFEGKRLPTAAEWAWAACGPDGRLCAVGRLRDLVEGRVHLDRPLAGVADGLSSADDRSPFGLYDMAGNVAEFSSTMGSLRGVTGWFVMGGSYLTPAARAVVTDAQVVAGWLPLQGVGFRCVREP